MKLNEQILDISNRWFNPHFTKAISFPRIVEALAVKFFDYLMYKGMENLTPEELLDMKAVYVAKRSIDRGDFSVDLQAVK